MCFVGMAHLRAARRPQGRLGFAILVAILWPEGLAGVAALDAESAAGDAPRKRSPRLHIGTFSDIYDPRLMLPMASAYANGLTPIVLGLGAQITWGPGMGRAWNTYRDFVWNKTEPEDVVLFFDAFDVMFQAGEAELLQMYHDIVARTGREIVYNADIYCSSSRKVDYPACTTPWCYLNCGIYMGRSSALRKLFKERLYGPRPKTRMARALTCRHWPSFGNPLRTGTCYACEFLRYTQPDLLALMEERGRATPRAVPCRAALEADMHVLFVGLRPAGQLECPERRLFHLLPGNPALGQDPDLAFGPLVPLAGPPSFEGHP